MILSNLFSIFILECKSNLYITLCHITFFIVSLNSFFKFWCSCISFNIFTIWKFFCQWISELKFEHFWVFIRYFYLGFFICIIWLNLNILNFLSRMMMDRSRISIIFLFNFNSYWHMTSWAFVSMVSSYEIFLSFLQLLPPRYSFISIPVMMIAFKVWFAFWPIRTQ